MYTLEHRLKFYSVWLSEKFGWLTFIREDIVDSYLARFRDAASASADVSEESPSIKLLFSPQASAEQIAELCGTWVELFSTVAIGRFVSWQPTYLAKVASFVIEANLALGAAVLTLMETLGRLFPFLPIEPRPGRTFDRHYVLLFRLLLDEEERDSYPESWASVEDKRSAVALAFAYRRMADFKEVLVRCLSDSEELNRLTKDRASRILWTEIHQLRTNWGNLEQALKDFWVLEGAIKERVLLGISLSDDPGSSSLIPSSSTPSRGELVGYLACEPESPSHPTVRPGERKER